MKRLFRIAIGLLFPLSLLSACGSGQPLNPTLSPTHLPTPTFTQIPTLQPTATAMSSIAMNCNDWALVNRGNFQAQNNTWGKGELTGWSQCIGIDIDTDGSLSGRWTWDWLNAGSGVKAYPEVVYGQKPGSASTAADLPQKIRDLTEVTVSYEVTSTHTGSGNIAFDIWLTDTPNPDTWGVPPITHEIMIWLDSYGVMSPGGIWLEEANIDGISYYVTVGENFGGGWRYIAFNRVPPQLGTGSLNITHFLSYLLEKNLITGEEYMASIEFGNEVVSGVGETVLNNYVVSVSFTPPAESAEEESGVFLQKLFESDNGGSIPYVIRIPENMDDVEKASSMKDVPFWVFHGEKDDVIPVEYSRAIVKALQDLGSSPKYTEYKDAGHGIWNQAYYEPELLSWLFSQQK